MGKANFWKFVNSADGESAELLLYGELSESSWWGDEVTPAQFNSDLAALGDVKSIKVRINSPGGDVFAGTAIYNSLRNHPATVTAYIDGIAASAASLVAMAGRVVMPATALLMVHNPSAMVWGDARAMRNFADILDTVRDSIIPAYEAKSGMTRAEVISLLNAGKDNSGTWMTAAEALDKGFADEIDEQLPAAVTMRGDMLIANGLGFDMKKFNLSPPTMLVTPPLGVDNSSESKPAEQTDTEVRNMADIKNEDVMEPVAEPTAVEPAAEVAEPIQSEAEPVAEPTEEAEVPAVDPVMAERERIKAIRALSFPGVMSVVDSAIDNGSTVEQAALAIMQSEEFKTVQASAARMRDAGAVDGVAVGGGEPQALTDEIIAKMTPEEQDARRADIIAFYQAKKAAK